MNQVVTPRYTFLTFQKAFQFFGYPHTWLEATSERPYEGMIVDARSEPTKPELPIQLLFQGDVFKPFEQASEVDVSVPLAESLVFYTTLSYDSPEERKLELAQLLNIFNRMMPIGGFALQTPGVIAFRFPLLSHTCEIHALLVIRVLKMIAFFVERCRFYLERFCTTQVPVQELIVQIEQGADLSNELSSL